MSHDPRLSRRLLPAAFLLALLPDLAQADILSRYDANATCELGSDGSMTIPASTIDFYETSCAIHAAREVARGLQLELSCEGEGEVWETDLTLTPTAEGVILSGEDDFGGQIDTAYRRCD